VSIDSSTKSTLNIEIKGCNPEMLFPSELPTVSIMIGTPKTIDFLPYLQNNDCFFSTSPDKNFFW
jgi:hypothetical protein